MRNIFIVSALLLCVLSVGCTQAEPKRFGPDHYELECIDRETWIVSEHGRGKLGAACE